MENLPDHEVEKAFGLYAKSEKESFIPLSSIDFDVNIQNSIAQIKITQEYINIYDNPIETFFLFPKTEKAIFTNMRVEFKDKVIESAIEEKNQAKILFEKSIAEGKTIALGETGGKMAPDFMKITIGNFPAKESMKIIFTYCQELEVELGKFWRLTIPSTLTPKYQNVTSQKKIFEKLLESCLKQKQEKIVKIVKK